MRDTDTGTKVEAWFVGLLAHIQMPFIDSPVPYAQGMALTTVGGGIDHKSIIISHRQSQMPIGTRQLFSVTLPLPQ